MSDDSYYTQEHDGFNRVTNKRFLMMLVVTAIVVVGIYLYRQATKPPTPDEAVETFMQAWSEWDSDIVEAMVPSDFYVRASRQWGVEWLERNRPTTWDIGEPFSKESIEMGRGFVDVDIDTTLLGEVELLVFFQRYTSGWKIEAIRTVD